MANAASMLLSPEERARFATWLEADAAVDEEIAARLRDLPGGMNERLAVERTHDASAKRRIAKQLHLIEDVAL